MKQYEYSRKLLVGVLKGSLIDLETTGLDASCDEIITFGYIQAHALTIIQRSEEKEETFIKQIKPTVKELPRPFYAYNAEFERNFLATKFGITAKFVDLMEPWKRKAEKCTYCHGSGIISGRACIRCWGRGKLKWPKLGELISEPGEYFGEKVIQGEDVPELWNKYRRTGDYRYLLPIIQHCEIDLLRELILLIHYTKTQLSKTSA